MVYTRVTSVKSPWLQGCEAGDIHCIPVSHGEGRFVAEESMLQHLAANGQIATQYVDPGRHTVRPISPGIRTARFGPLRALPRRTAGCSGKMGHSERRGEDLYRNVPGEKDQKLFASGVQYFA